MRRVDSLQPPELLTDDGVRALVGKLANFARSRPAIRLFYLHGSHATGKQGPLSDIDLAVYLDPAYLDTDKGAFDLLLALQEECGREDVDLVVLNQGGPLIKERVVRTGKLVYATSEPERTRFEAQAIKEAIDFRYFSATYNHALFHQLAQGQLYD